MSSRGRKPSNEKQQLRAQLESIRGETRRLQEKYTVESEHLKRFSLHQDRVLAYINDVNNQKKLLEQQISVAKKNEDIVIQELERNLRNIAELDQKKLLSATKSRVFYSRLIREVKDKITNLETDIQKKVQVYDQSIRSREITINESIKKLKDLEDQELKLFTAILNKATNPLSFIKDSHDDLDDYTPSQNEQKTKSNHSTNKSAQNSNNNSTANLNLNSGFSNNVAKLNLKFSNELNAKLSSDLSSKLGNELSSRFSDLNKFNHDLGMNKLNTSDLNNDESNEAKVLSKQIDALKQIKENLAKQIYDLQKENSNETEINKESGIEDQIENENKKEEKENQVHTVSDFKLNEDTIE
ncbi:hypothetical protein TRFO_35674 [Tritrichomonas foetus]|uniref:Uncharacterized protein n=1 Tax=Tritrichomonas foetus TaxID=1144522 RepID=A0A1J4JH40_9EUKA|nr:hypothetical protein TRFO_35674 [Tritrichomonas foetus]|eukprot:OHS98025.1 hypothetical protein TRFO_35674 [Tritrichomonas foetus]